MALGVRRATARVSTPTIDVFRALRPRFSCLLSMLGGKRSTRSVQESSIVGAGVVLGVVGTLVVARRSPTPDAPPENLPVPDPCGRPSNPSRTHEIMPSKNPPDVKPLRLPCYSNGTVLFPC